MNFVDYMIKTLVYLHKISTYESMAAEPLIFAYKVWTLAYKVCKVACYVIIYCRALGYVLRNLQKTN